MRLTSICIHPLSSARPALTESLEHRRRCENLFNNSLESSGVLAKDRDLKGDGLNFLGLQRGKQFQKSKIYVHQCPRYSDVFLERSGKHSHH